ncbi:MAG: type II toxin-antitoxin system VapC family toxin [Azoarcus sp.]|jgi:uncharacterized protein with PIN domain|nr:type II toxin-antitoxin system VapC family toxin [Azoarcus sp.]
MSIVIDTSALVAIVFAEPERSAFLDIVTHAQRVLIFKGDDFSRTDIAPAFIAQSV